MSVSTVTPAVVAEIAAVGNFNEYLREASTEELKAQAERIERELSKNSSTTRNALIDILRDRLSSLQRVLSLC